MNLDFLMTNANLFFAFGAPVQPGQPQPSILTSLIPMVLMIAIFYFILIRPQMKMKKEQDQMQTSLKQGDSVITSGGIIGTISSVKDTSVMLKVEDGTKLEVLKSHISTRVVADKKA
jgi:preprotein translocase subunit YajC